MTESEIAELDRKIAVMKASKTKEMQRGCFLITNAKWEWKDDPSPAWNWAVHDYRVKPQEPRRIWVNDRPPMGVTTGCAWASKEEAESACSDGSQVEFIELTPEIKQRLGL